jgi:SPP1 family predicted phage head-tail adaptor
MALDIGRMRERVTVQQATERRNSLGETTLEWATYATRWASVQGVSSREAIELGQVDVSVTHRVRMRYVDGMTHNMRLLWRGRVLEIVSLLEYDNRSEHVAVCEEAV